MIKGCSRKMIVLKNTGSDIFDEAYFILKSRPQGSYVGMKTEKDFICEANRIIAGMRSEDGKSESTVNNGNPKNKNSRFWWGVLAGAVITAVFCAGIMIFGK